jgi:hypothetical protein
VLRSRDESHEALRPGCAHPSVPKLEGRASSPRGEFITLEGGASSSLRRRNPSPLLSIQRRNRSGRRAGNTAMRQFANRNSKVWHGATETGP